MGVANHKKGGAISSFFLIDEGDSGCNSHQLFFFHPHTILWGYQYLYFYLLIFLWNSTLNTLNVFIRQVK